MGNLFSKVDLKVCKTCGEEKPILLFPSKGKINGKIRHVAHCKICYGKHRWAAMSEEAKERKRERERQYIAIGKAKERMQRSNANRNKKISLMRAERRLIENVGAHCIIHWHQCERCNKRQLYRKEVADTVCGVCRRTEAQIGRKMPLKELKCIDCSKTILGTLAKKRCDLCAKKKEKTYRRNRRKVIGGRLRSALDRAKKHGVHIEAVKPSVVYKRDKYTCYLCGDKVVKSKTYHPKQATIDHVVPLAKGGPHTYDNVRCCCHACNGRKADSMPEAYKSKGIQMSLFTIERVEGHRGLV